MKYFSKFPSLYYSLKDDDTNLTQVKNIFLRLNFVKQVLENTDLYYDYTMKDTDTPEILAHKLYGDANRYWIIMMVNQIIDPYFDLPLQNEALEKYIASKYRVGAESNATTFLDDLANAKTTIHHYEKQITTKTKENSIVSSNTVSSIITNPYYDDFSGNITNYSLPSLVSPITQLSSKTEEINGITITRTTNLVAITCYDYEVSLNESKRNIKLLNPNYVPMVEDNFAKLAGR